MVKGGKFKETTEMERTLRLVLIRWASLVAQLVNNLPARWETWVGKIPWRREQLPTPVFWPQEFHGLYSPWDGKESDRTEQLSLSFFHALKLTDSSSEPWTEPAFLEKFVREPAWWGGG